MEAERLCNVSPKNSLILDILRLLVKLSNPISLFSLLEPLCELLLHSLFSAHLTTHFPQEEEDFYPSCPSGMYIFLSCSFKSSTSLGHHLYIVTSIYFSLYIYLNTHHALQTYMQYICTTISCTLGSHNNWLLLGWSWGEEKGKYLLCHHLSSAPPASGTKNSQVCFQNLVSCEKQKSFRKGEVIWTNRTQISWSALIKYERMKGHKL